MDEQTESKVEHLSEAPPQAPAAPAAKKPKASNSRVLEARYSLRELMAEVGIERKDSAFAHELVDNEEIRKMFKAVRAEKRKLRNG